MMDGSEDLDLRGLRVVGSAVPEEDIVAREDARRRLASLIESERPPRRVRRPRLAIAIVVTMIFAVGTVVMTSIWHDSGHAAAAVLRDLALRTEEGTTVPVSGTYVYVHSSGTVLVGGTDITSQASWAAVTAFTRDVWLGADGAGRLAQSRTGATFVTPADEAAWRAAGSPPVETSEDRTYGPGELYLVDPKTVPADEDELRSALDSGQLASGPDGDATTLRAIGSLLGESYLSPQQRSSLFAVASGLPGIRSLGDLTDHLGRTGPAVSAEDGQGEVTLIFDADSSRLLELRSTWPEFGVTTWSTFGEPILTGGRDGPA